MDYVAQKPCCFGGRRFRIGDQVPAEVVHAGMAQKLVKMGVIAIQNPQQCPGQGETPTRMTGTRILLREEAGDRPLELTGESLQAVFDVLTGNVSQGEVILQQITEPDALLLLQAAASRKTVKEAAQERAKVLLAGKDAGEA